MVDLSPDAQIYAMGMERGLIFTEQRMNSEILEIRSHVADLEVGHSATRRERDRYANALTKLKKLIAANDANELPQKDTLDRMAGVLDSIEVCPF